MKVKESVQELMTTLGRACYDTAINEALHDMENLKKDIQWGVENKTIDPIDLIEGRQRLARRALQIQQQQIPLLNETVTKLLEIAGKEAVERAIAPIHREGTDRLGQPMPPIPSDFIDPDKFAQQAK